MQILKCNFYRYKQLLSYKQEEGKTKHFPLLAIPLMYRKKREHFFKLLVLTKKKQATQTYHKYKLLFKTTSQKLFDLTFFTLNLYLFFIKFRPTYSVFIIIT